MRVASAHREAWLARPRDVAPRNQIHVDSDLVGGTGRLSDSAAMVSNGRPVSSTWGNPDHRVSRAQHTPLCSAGLSSGLWEEVPPGSLFRADTV